MQTYIKQILLAMILTVLTNIYKKKASLIASFKKYYERKPNYQYGVSNHLSGYSKAAPGP